MQHSDRDRNGEDEISVGPKEITEGGRTWSWLRGQGVKKQEPLLRARVFIQSTFRGQAKWPVRFAECHFHAAQQNKKLGGAPPAVITAAVQRYWGPGKEE